MKNDNIIDAEYAQRRRERVTCICCQHSFTPGVTQALQIIKHGAALCNACMPPPSEPEEDLKAYNEH